MLSVISTLISIVVTTKKFLNWFFQVQSARSPSVLQKQPTDYSNHLPEGWERNMAVADRTWVARSLFVSKGTLAPKLKNWYYPHAVPSPSQQPNPSSYFL